MPSLSRVALLVNPNVPSSRRYIDESEEAAGGLGLSVQPFEVRALDDIDRAFDAMVKARMQAVSMRALERAQLPTGGTATHTTVVAESVRGRVDARRLGDQPSRAIRCPFTFQSGANPGPNRSRFSL